MTKITNTHLEHAIALACSAHSQQTDWLGNAYILHPLRVMDAVGIEAPVYVKVAAVLHDIVEDTHITIQDIEDFYGRQVKHIVACLTRTNDVDYLDYIRHQVCAGPPEAKLIKRADIMDNYMRPMPPEKMPLRDRYWKALSIIDGFNHFESDDRIYKNEYERKLLDDQQKQEQEDWYRLEACERHGQD